MKIIWSDISETDLLNIREYISKDNPYLADSFISKLILSTDKLTQFPKMGRIVPEFNDEEIREIIYRNYRIIYKLFSDHIYILTIYHGARNLLDQS